VTEPLDAPPTLSVSWRRVLQRRDFGSVSVDWCSLWPGAHSPITSVGPR
jgi:hypothetical protein